MKKIRMNFYIEKKEKELLEKKSKELKISSSNIIRKLIQDYLKIEKE